MEVINTDDLNKVIIDYVEVKDDYVVIHYKLNVEIKYIKTTVLLLAG